MKSALDGAKSVAVTRKTVALFSIGIAVSVTVILAHHSISGAYDTSRQLTLEGRVAQFQFINPHPFLTLEVSGGTAKAQLWSLEMDNRSELVQIGMSSQTLKPGDRIVATGSPGRASAQTLYVNRLDRSSDGFRYEQIGASPRISTVR